MKTKFEELNARQQTIITNLLKVLPDGDLITYYVPEDDPYSFGPPSLIVDVFKPAQYFPKKMGTLVIGKHDIADLHYGGGFTFDNNWKIDHFSLAELGLYPG
jgi:hypothetical protein